MLVNRTCHVVEGGGREVKLPYLVFCVVVPLKDFIAGAGDQKNLNNQISNIVNQKTESICYLPACKVAGIEEPLVADFNMVFSMKLADCPPANTKLLELTSPFSEHVFQRFSRWFYTVGFDDVSQKDKGHVGELTGFVEKHIAQLKAQAK